MSQKQIEDIKMEYDVVDALLRLGHEVQVLPLDYDLVPLRTALAEWKPHIVFNMLQEFHGTVVFEQNVVAYLELMRTPYTGCNPRGLLLARDKALVKKILSYHRIPTPRFVVAPLGRKPKKITRLTYPLIVKSADEDASIGISQSSFVTNEEQLGKRIEFIHEQVQTDALVEEYVDGRELYLGILGNIRLQTFPLWELVLDSLPEGTPRIATARIKFDPEFQVKYKIISDVAKGIEPEAAERIARLAKRIYRVLGLSGYARLDIRFAPSGEAYVLEINPNAQLVRDE
jgi:D-alanine-D-alanine ligase